MGRIPTTSPHLTVAHDTAITRTRKVIACPARTILPPPPCAPVAVDVEAGTRPTCSTTIGICTATLQVATVRGLNISLDNADVLMVGAGKLARHMDTGA